MRNVTYSMGCRPTATSSGRTAVFDWTAPDAEMFRFVLDQIPEVDVHLLGGRPYETMLYWEPADEDPALSTSATA